MDAVYDGIVGAVAIKQVRSGSFDSGVEIVPAKFSGGLDAQVFYIMGAGPRLSWSSTDIAGILTGISPTTGLNVSAGTITLPFQRRAQGGTFSGSSANMIVTGANGLTIPVSISASNEHAMVALDTMFRSTDGITTPVTASISTTLSAQAFNVAYAYGKTQLTIAGGSAVNLAQVTNVTVNTGLQVVPTTFAGHIYPTVLNIVSRDPSIDITFCDLDAAYTYGPLFAGLDACAVYFRKRADLSTFVSDATSEHVKMSFAGSITGVQQLQAADQGNASATFRIFGKALTTSVVSAIPA